MSTIRVLMLESPLYSHHISRAISLEAVGIEIVGVTQDVSAAEALMRTLTPDVLLVDLNKVWKENFEPLRTICRACPKTLVLARTRNLDRAFILNAIHAGVMGFLPADCHRDQILMAIHTLRQGNPYLPHEITKVFIDGVRHHKILH